MSKHLMLKTLDLHTHPTISHLVFGLNLAIFLFQCQPSPAPVKSPSFESNRFKVVDLLRNLNEPMSLDFLPDGRIILIERRGILKIYDPATKVVKVAGALEVNYINENGLLGMVVDPEYATNSWIYLFYTDPLRKSYQHISRFKFKNDSLITASEKLLLDYYIDYDHCCHFGGSLDFVPEGLLYISTGDNVGGTNYGPLDERPGHHLHDAQRTSGNTMDLRGKILRIRPKADGSYSIPQGNLFPPDTPLSRPEIYVMGVRNPFKFKVDQNTGWLFWGEVGPNPGEGDPKRGPRAHEEINLAKSAGNYGWPYLIGDNKAYYDYNYQTGEIGLAFDPKALINDSPNNTGMQQLPPARNALIWYPNVVSDSFPLTGQGGGTACAGPVYHFREQDASADNFPREFDDNLIIYDWMRGWFRAVTLDPDGKYLGMEKFLPDSTFKKPIDARFGMDGALYVLDYGSNWYAHNEDAGLTRVSYTRGNRTPQARITTDKKVGKVPLTVRFSGQDSFDPDQESSLSYQWSFGGTNYTSHEINPIHTFQKSGIYQVTLSVRDQHGAENIAQETIQIGNEPPQVTMSIEGNRSFYRPTHPITYSVSVFDLEDGSSVDGSIKTESVAVNLITLENNSEINNLRNLESLQDPTIPYLQGKRLMQGSDCYACHALDAPSVGPSLQEISERYVNDKQAVEYLSAKIKVGGTGVWGNKLMTAHPQHNDVEIREMVAYILSLTQKPLTGTTLPIKGAFYSSSPDPNSVMVLSASYQDLGGNGLPPLRQEARSFLRSPMVPAVSYDVCHRVIPKPYNDQGDLYAEIALNGSYIGFRELDLSGVEAIRVKLRSNANFIKIEVRERGPQGELLTSKRVDLPYVEDKWEAFTEEDWFEMDLPLASTNFMGDLYFIFYSDKKESDYIYFDICQLLSLEFIFEDNANL